VLRPRSAVAICSACYYTRLEHASHELATGVHFIEKRVENVCVAIAPMTVPSVKVLPDQHCTVRENRERHHSNSRQDNGTLDSGVHHRFLGACPPGPASLNYPVFADVAGTGLSDSH
jgi:hypothetical protein